MSGRECICGYMYVHMCIYVYRYIYVYEELFSKAPIQKKWVYNAHVKFVNRVLEKSSSDIFGKAFMFIYMKSSLPKRNKRYLKKMGLYCQYQVHTICFGKELFAYIRVCVHIYKELFSKVWSPNLAFTLQTRFFDWRL